eukprot:NODE_408_length_9221_cov_0.216400.p5 type:complete len:195 gc:universal NODE_408_length_9221_cov_0.216400:3919-3335(-)
MDQEQGSETNAAVDISISISKPKKGANQYHGEKIDSYFTEDEIQRLYKRFQKLDQNGNGQIEKSEFESIAAIKSNPLASRLIEIFDSDGNGDVDFQEFVRGLNVFSAFGKKDDKLKFLFQVYDIDKDGFISNTELFAVLKMMVGSNLNPEQLQQIVDKTILESDKDKDGKISFQEFKMMTQESNIVQKMVLNNF